MGARGKQSIRRGKDLQVEAEFREYSEKARSTFKNGITNAAERREMEEFAAFLNQHRSYLDERFRKQYLLSASFAAEALELFGSHDKSTRLIEPLVGEVRDRLEQLSDEVDQESWLNLEWRMTKREEIRLMINFAQIVLYRLHKYDQADAVIKKCREWLKFIHHKTYFPCYGTQAQLAYVEGKVARQRHDLKTAQLKFEEAIRFQCLRFEQSCAEYENQTDPEMEGQAKKKLEDERKFTIRRLAIGLSRGLGWLFHEQGAVTRAQDSYVLPARLLLMQSEDKVTKAYADLLYASILRTLATKGDERLQRAIVNVRRAQEYFEEVGHERYLTRARFEEALCRLRMGDFDLAERLVAKVQSWADKNDDKPWQCQAMVIKAQIELERGDHNKSLDLAKEALEIADNCNQPVRKIDAHFACAEAYLKLCRQEAQTGNKERLRLEFNNVRKELEQAEEIHRQISRHNETSANPKLSAVIHLLRAQAWAIVGNPHQAGDHFQLWKKIEDRIEHQDIKDLAREAQTEIDKMSHDQDFVLSPQEALEMGYKEIQRRLREYLIKQAERKVAVEGRDLTKHREEVAKQLDLSRQGLHLWERQIKDSKK